MDNYDLQVDIAKKIFLDYDQKRIIDKFRLDTDEQYIYLSYLGTPCRICRKTGTVEQYLERTWQGCRQYSAVMTIYDLLCHHKGGNCPGTAWTVVRGGDLCGYRRYRNGYLYKEVCKAV